MLSELTSSRKRLALVGLAKNTGKTETLATLLRELQAQGRTVGVTSVGRDGEERDVIDARIEKPRVRLPTGSLVANTDSLMRASVLSYELLEETDVRTPLGRVLVARLLEPGTIEVAGPSAAADVRAVSDAMLARGAEQVLIDGAIDRRAASSPDVADGLVLATGAVLDHDIEQVVLQTRDAVDLVRMPLVASSPGEEDTAGDESKAVSLPPRLVLTAESEQVAELLDEHPHAERLLVAGALPERFLRSLLHPLQHRRREVQVVVQDPTKVFLWKRGPDWYARQGVHLRARERTTLDALTINPVAPQSHRFASADLRELLAAAIPDLPIFDVRHLDYGRAPLRA